MIHFHGLLSHQGKLITQVHVNENCLRNVWRVLRAQSVILAIKIPIIDRTFPNYLRGGPGPREFMPSNWKKIDLILRELLIWVCN